MSWHWVRQWGRYPFVRLGVLVTTRSIKLGILAQYYHSDVRTVHLALSLLVVQLTFVVVFLRSGDTWTS